MGKSVLRKDFLKGVKQFLEGFSDEELRCKLEEKQIQLEELEGQQQAEKLRWLNKPKAITNNIVFEPSFMNVGVATKIQSRILVWAQEEATKQSVGKHRGFLESEKNYQLGVAA